MASSTTSSDHPTLSEEEPIEVLLYGLGAIGSFYAFILSRVPGVRLSVVARSNYEAVKANGFLIKSMNHGDHQVRPAGVYRTAAEASTKFDYVICTNKAVDLEQTVREISPVVDEARTSIVIFQNGVGNEDPFRAAFPKVTICSGIVWVGGVQPSPGVVHHTTSEWTQIGLFPNPHRSPLIETERMERLVNLFITGGTKITIESNIQLPKWEKVIWNIAWNGLTTLTDVDTQQWLHSSPLAVPMTEKLMRETIAVGQAVGVQGLEDSLVEKLFQRINELPGVITSMQTDNRCGRRLELDVILGTPVKKGRELGVSIPILETIYTVLLAVDWRLQNVKKES